MGALRMDLRASLYGAAFLGGVLLSLGGCFVELWSLLTESSAVDLTTVEASLCSQTLRFCLPVAAALPYGAAWQEQTASGFWRFSVSRGGRAGFCLGKLLVSWLSGAGAVSLGLLIFFGISARVIPEREAVDQLILECFPRITALAGLYALLSVAGALVFRNRIAAWFTPFLCCFLLTMLQERYLQDIRCLDLMTWPARVSVAAAILVCCALFFPMERRLRA